jgi:hypothetical protein
VVLCCEAVLALIRGSFVSASNEHAFDRTSERTVPSPSDRTPDTFEHVFDL